jgi:Protein kinase domain
MGAAAHRRARTHNSWFPHYRVTMVSVILFFALLIVPSAASASSGNAGIAGVTADRSIHSTIAPGISTVQPSANVPLQPTPVLTRQNRTQLIQIVKIGTERPKVTVPSGVFLLIVAIAVAGLLAILYVLIRRNTGSSGIQKKPGDTVPGNATIIGKPVTPASESAGSADGPAVSFPPSLEKRYIHPEFIGEGGLARVFRAQNAKTGRIVAVKVPVRFDEVTGTHFTRDIVFWQGLEHTNIIRIWSSNILPVPYIEMEYAPSSLAAIPLPLSEKEAVRILLGIARGLAYAHEKGIVHRDIKPENILLSAEGVPKITDWGLGKSIGDTRQSSVIGFSPAYAAPEQIAPHRYGRPGPATDIYQIGMLLCELLTGAPAFRAEGMHDLNMAILDDTPVIPRWNGSHGLELERIIRRCLAKKPEERYVSIADFIRDLEFLQTFPE